MKIKERIFFIFTELKAHAPFTLIGAILGVAFFIIFKDISKPHAQVMFGIFHPAHVLLSAMVTASIFAVHFKKKKFLIVLIIGYVGSIGIATLSDSIVPYIGEKIFSLDVPTHDHSHAEPAHEEDVTHVHTEDCDDHAHAVEAVHEHTAECDSGHDGHGIHLGFLEQWYVVHPAALLGVILAWYIPRSKCPHATHVFISTWASSAHILMNLNRGITLPVIAEVFGILFLAVWLPCCISDIIFPLLFVDSEMALAGGCACHSKRKQESTNE